MLQVTTDAINALEQARSEQEIPEDHGLRISAQPDPQDPSKVSLGLGFTDAPADGDQVTEQDGTEIYVAPELAAPLADSVIDVEDSPEGVQLIVKPQDDA